MKRKRGSQSCLCYVTPVVDMGVAEFEESGRLHKLESLCQDLINLNHLVISWPKLGINGPGALL
jgi:hypothetical protein